MKRTHAFFMLTALFLRLAHASGHGPVFALATPTNPQGGFSFDTSLMRRYSAGDGTMYRGTLGYGVTEDFKLSLSAPIILRQEPFIDSRTASTTPMGGVAVYQDVAPIYPRERVRAAVNFTWFF